MNPVYLDLHIHTSENPDKINSSYDVSCIKERIETYCNNSAYLISFTDHNIINKKAYIDALRLEIRLLLGVELHIKNYDNADAYHCHIYFNLEKITEEIIDDLNAKLYELYPQKVLEKSDKKIPHLDNIVKTFEGYDFLLLPHGGQSHATFDSSIPDDVRFDGTMERTIYYNQIDGFTARGKKGFEKTREYLKKLGISDFVNLITCTDNYNPSKYPEGKSTDEQEFIPTWMFAEPTFDGLRLSLSESTRLHYGKDKPCFDCENIKSVKLSNEKIDININLYPGLNVVIGGSSSGKTLLVDSMYRGIIQDFTDSKYIYYGVDKINVNNPSGMIPHYLEQNYVMTVVNDGTDKKIEDIPIIKKVFPGAKEISENILKTLEYIKRKINKLIFDVQELEDATNTLSKIPIFSRLVTSKKVQTNLFELLIPEEKLLRKIHYTDFEDDNVRLDKISNFLKNNPLLSDKENLINEIKLELIKAKQISSLSEAILKTINKAKTDFDYYLKQTNDSDISKREEFQKLITTIQKYMGFYKEFNSILYEISNYTKKFESEKFISMGHTLCIKYEFEINKVKLLEIINKYIKVPVADLIHLSPEDLFASNLKKQKPKVKDYDDLSQKISYDLEYLNIKTFDITSKNGKKFEFLSAGWKTSIILDLILGYEEDRAPIIIDQPEDNLATNYINTGLVNALKKTKIHKQVILVSHNATIPMLADAQNVIVCKNENNKIIIRSARLEGKIENKTIVDYIAEITDGGKASIKKRVKKYNLKTFKGE